MSLVNVSYAQESAPRDTLVIEKSDLDAPIFYSARDSIYSDLKKKQVHLYGDAKVDNGEINMSAGYILIDLNKNEVLATYAYDKDSSKVEFPLFSDGSDQIKASTIRYNFNTEKGFIEEVAIVQDEMHLYMEVAKRHANEEIHFKKGRFTTCDLEEPHYHFQLSKAVMIPNKRIVTGAMNLWVGGVPTPLGLPFSVIPQAEEKSKGLIFPQFVPISNFGFGIQDLGYYVPINDNLQTTFYGTLYSRGSWGLRNVTDYSKKYGFQGSTNIGFQQFKSGFPTNSNQNKLSLGWIHSKDAKSSPYWGFRANVNYISDNNTQNNLDPINDQYFNNTLTSDINLTRRFPNVPILSAGMKIRMRQNSVSENISLTSPVMNVNVTRFFPLKKLVNGSKGWRQLLTRFGVTYNFEGQNRALFSDSLLTKRDLAGINDEFLNGFSHTFNLQTTASLFKNTLKVTPSLQYGNKMNFQQTNRWYDTANDSMIVDKLPRFGTADDLSLNVQATTVLYSYYRFVGKNKPLVRHVLTPTVSYRYVPNLNSNKIVYDGFGADRDTIVYSPFEQSLYSVGNTRDQQLITFGFNNTLELKRKSDKDTVDGFKRTRLIDGFSITGNYDILKDSNNLSNISLNLRISPVKWLNFVSTSSFSAYAWDESTGRTTQDWALDSNGRLGRFINTNLTTTVTFTSQESRKEIEKTQKRIEENWTSDYAFFALHPEHAINFDIPWKVTLSHVYQISANQNISTTSTDRYTDIQTLMVTGDVSFTKRWKLATTTNLDLATGRVTNSRFTLTRDMHCWALAFHYTPIGLNKSFLFSIRSTSMLFKDAKIDVRRPPSFL
ncbi:MAG: putative LPS assembly protein LptD [Crocinitomicaceae bacterium]|nr:putative LPS assembly protein LptD [Crocinitomicaceae bacterium]